MEIKISYFAKNEIEGWKVVTKFRKGRKKWERVKGAMLMGPTLSHKQDKRFIHDAITSWDTVVLFKLCF